MSVFVDKNSRVAVQGMTGKEGSYWTKLMKDMGTQVVFGCTPGKEGQDVAGIPVYHTMRRGMKDHPADVSMVFVPPRFAKDAVFEALDAGIRKICVTADGIPVRAFMHHNGGVGKRRKRRKKLAAFKRADITHRLRPPRSPRRCDPLPRSRQEALRSLHRGRSSRPHRTKARA